MSDLTGCRAADVELCGRDGQAHADDTRLSSLEANEPITPRPGIWFFVSDIARADSQCEHRSKRPMSCAGTERSRDDRRHETDASLIACTDIPPRDANAIDRLQGMASVSLSMCECECECVLGAGNAATDSRGLRPSEVKVRHDSVVYEAGHAAEVAVECQYGLCQITAHGW